MKDRDIEKRRIFWRGDRIEWVLARGFHAWFFNEIKDPFRSMAFHDFMIIEIPLHDKPSVSIDMHMSRRVISFPPNKDVTTTSEFAHSTVMVPCKVTLVNLSPEEFSLA